MFLIVLGFWRKDAAFMMGLLGMLMLHVTAGRLCVGLTKVSGLRGFGWAVGWKRSKHRVLSGEDCFRYKQKARQLKLVHEL